MAQRARLITVKKGRETENALITASREGMLKTLSARNPAPKKMSPGEHQAQREAYPEHHQNSPTYPRHILLGLVVSDVAHHPWFIPNWAKTLATWTTVYPKT